MSAPPPMGIDQNSFPLQRPDSTQHIPARPSKFPGMPPGPGCPNYSPCRLHVTSPWGLLFSPFS